jgi:hypothetical protein
VNWVKHSLKGQVPSKRHGHTANLFGDKLILYGGITEEGYSNEIFMINLHTFECEKFQQYGNIPDPRAFHACEIYLNNTLILCGGIKRKETINSNTL